jgi:hypothetical protein
MCDELPARGGSMPHSKKQSMVITTSGNRPIQEVAKELKDAGFEVEQVLEDIKVITGKGSAGTDKKLRSIKDVEDVSEDNPVSIGPPDAEIS